MRIYYNGSLKCQPLDCPTPCGRRARERLIHVLQTMHSSTMIKTRINTQITIFVSTLIVKAACKGVEICYTFLLSRGAIFTLSCPFLITTYHNMAMTLVQFSIEYRK